MAGQLVELQLEHGELIAAGLRAAPREMKKNLGASNRALGRLGRDWARSAASAGSRQQAAAVMGIQGGGTATAATIKITRTASVPFALGAFYGSKKYAQFPEWVGVGWSVGVAGEGPLPSQALAPHAAEIDELYLAGQLQAVASAFPRL